MLVFCIIFFSFIVFSVLEAVGGADNSVSKTVHGMLAGFVSVFVFHIFAPYTGVEFPISVFSVLIGAVGGIPGAALLFGLNALF